MKIEVKTREGGVSELWVNEQIVATGVDITCFTDAQGTPYGIATR